MMAKKKVTKKKAGSVSKAKSKKFLWWKVPVFSSLLATLLIAVLGSLTMLHQSGVLGIQTSLGPRPIPVTIYITIKETNALTNGYFQTTPKKMAAVTLTVDGVKKSTVMYPAKGGPFAVGGVLSTQTVGISVNVVNQYHQLLPSYAVYYNSPNIFKVAVLSACTSPTKACIITVTDPLPTPTPNIKPRICAAKYIDTVYCCGTNLCQPYQNSDCTITDKVIHYHISSCGYYLPTPTPASHPGGVKLY